MPRRKLRVPRKSNSPTKSRKKAAIPPPGVEVALWLYERRELLMPAEVAAILRIDKKKVYVLPIPRVELSPRRTRYDPLSVRDYLQSKTTGMIGTTHLASFCTSTGMRGGLMEAGGIAKLLRIGVRDVARVDIPPDFAVDGERHWDAAQVAAWIWGHRAEPTND
jgi:hypothetical protein